MLVSLAKLNGAPILDPSPVLRSKLAARAIGAFPNILHPFRHSPGDPILCVPMVRLGAGESS
jgi:hypothetical protein